MQRAGRSRGIAWLVLLALAAWQLANAEHAAAHSAFDLAESCEFCVQLKDNNPPVSGVVADIEAQFDRGLRPEPLGQDAPQRLPLTQRSRAPPTQ